MFDQFKPIDRKAERRRRLLIAALAFLVMLTGYLYFQFRNYREERTARSFFEALVRQDYPEAHRIWQPTKSYNFKDFMQDWGDHGLQGVIQSFRVTGSTRRGSGVVVRILVNGNHNVSLWVERKDRSISFPP